MTEATLTFYTVYGMAGTCDNLAFNYSTVIPLNYSGIPGVHFKPGVFLTYLMTSSNGNNVFIATFNANIVRIDVVKEGRSGRIFGTCNYLYN